MLLQRNTVKYRTLSLVASLLQVSVSLCVAVALSVSEKVCSKEVTLFFPARTGFAAGCQGPISIRLLGFPPPRVCSDPSFVRLEELWSYRNQ